MTLEEMLARLEGLGIPSDAYSLGRDRDESYCMIPEGGRWKVYFSERGARLSETALKDEVQAFETLLVMLLGDHTVREQMSEGG